MPRETDDGGAIYSPRERLVALLIASATLGLSLLAYRVLGARSPVMQFVYFVDFIGVWGGLWVAVVGRTWDNDG